MKLYREATSDEIGQWLLEPLYVVPVTIDYETATKVARVILDLFDQSGGIGTDEEVARAIVNAALGVGETP